MTPTRDGNSKQLERASKCSTLSKRHYHRHNKGSFPSTCIYRPVNIKLLFNQDLSMDDEINLLVDLFPPSTPSLEAPCISFPPYAINQGLLGHSRDHLLRLLPIPLSSSPVDNSLPVCSWTAFTNSALHVLP